MSNNNNKSKAAIGVQESWASNLSDYILLRRQQTHLAYSADQSRIRCAIWVAKSVVSNARNANLCPDRHPNQYTNGRGFDS